MNAGGRPWVRSSTGILAGVCKGLANRFDLDVLWVRLGLLFSIFILGTGCLVYLILALALPREDRLDQAHAPRLMGVCAKIAQRFDLDVGLVRTAFLFLLVTSFGGMFLMYLILYFITPSREEWLEKKFRS